MNRRQFVRSVGQGSVAMMFGLQATRLWGAPPHKQLPIDCSPPAHGAAKHITFNTSNPILPRKSVWDLSPAEVKRLQAAYQALRNLSTTKPNDPRGWAQQANVHCFNCSGGYDPSNVEIHGSWWFLPWHRCYLHVHERILGKLIGDPTFRLAYWDWDTYAQHAILPPPFAAAGPLYDSWRGATPTDVIPSDITGSAAMAAVYANQTAALFMGSASDPANNVYNPGALENSPHGPVHLWTGAPNPSQAPLPPGCYYPNTAGGTPVDQSSNGCVDMGVLATAAQDPIFFAHHSNIDRVWDKWLAMPGSQGNWTAPDWLSQRFNFYDENGDWVYLTVADVLTTKEQSNLRYLYQPPQKAAVTTTPKPSPKTAAIALKSVQPLVVTAPAAPIAVGTKPHVKSVAVPQEHRDNLRAVVLSTAPAQAKHYVLHIDGLTLPANESAIIHVFAGEPNATRETPLGATFIGTFALVPAGPQHQHAVVRNAAFQIRPETAKILAEQKELVVTLVPRLVNGKEPAKSDLTYRKIYLSVE
jgi:polyphenol oxidase